MGPILNSAVELLLLQGSSCIIYTRYLRKQLSLKEVRKKANSPQNMRRGSNKGMINVVIILLMVLFTFNYNNKGK